MTPCYIPIDTRGRQCWGHCGSCTLGVHSGCALWMRQAVLGALRSLPATPYVPYPLYTPKLLGFEIGLVVRPLHTCNKQHSKGNFFHQHLGFEIGLVVSCTPAPVSGQQCKSNTLGTLEKGRHPEVRILPGPKRRRFYRRDGVKPLGSVGGATSITAPLRTTIDPIHA